MKIYRLLYLFCPLMLALPIDAKEDLAPLPPEKEGAFPIHIPDYQGIEQLLLLNNRWVIVVTTNTQEVLDTINQLSKGKFYELVNKWEKSKKTNHLDWYSKKTSEGIYDKYIAQARLQTGELELDRADTYTISSATDKNFSKPQHPLRVTRTILSLNKEELPGEAIIHYAHYSYLELPTPMQNGQSYTFQLNNGKKVTLLYDELKTVSRAIKINQIGYLPNSSQKFAYLGCYLQEFGPLDCSEAKTFSVISVLTGQPVYTGKIKLRGSNPTVTKMTGEMIYEMDLSDLKEEGDFFISIPGVGRSWAFRHAQDAYGEAFYIATRGLYHQRCGVKIEQPYSAWPRILCHTQPVYESEALPLFGLGATPSGYDNFNVIGATIDTTKKTNDARGGWHDAADWDRNIAHYIDVLDLLGAYEIAPSKFSDGQLNIPESGDGIPDILSEAEYGLRVWKKSLDYRYGAAGLVETWTHPSIDDPKVKYAFSQRTRWASLLFASAAAQFAHLVQPFNTALSDEYKDLAFRTYNFGIDPQNSLGKTVIHAAKDRGHGEKYTMQWEEKDSYSYPFLVSANLRMFILTKDPNFLKDVPKLLEKVNKPYIWPNTLRDYSAWLYFPMFSEEVAPYLPKSDVQKWKKNYTDPADDLLKSIADQPYRQTWPLAQDYWMAWGSTVMTNQSRCLLLAYQITHNKKYKDAALVNLDYMLGNNPMGMSWTTGMGYVYPIWIQHAVSEDDGIMDPVPGITIYGLAGGIFYDLKKIAWDSPQPNKDPYKFLKEGNRDIPVFRRWSCHPTRNTTQCEFTIHETMASTIFATAFFLSEDWKPNERLKNLKPRQDNLLFGYWYLP